MGPLKEAIADLFEPAQLLTVLRVALSRPSAERPTGAIGGALDRLDALIYEEIARRRGAERPGASARTSCRCCCRRATRTARR